MVRRLRFYEKGLMCGIHKKRNLPKKHAKITDMIKLMIYSEDDPRVHNAFVHHFIAWVLLISDQIRKKNATFFALFLVTRKQMFLFPLEINQFQNVG